MKYAALIKDNTVTNIIVLSDNSNLLDFLGDNDLIIEYFTNIFVTIGSNYDSNLNQFSN